MKVRMGHEEQFFARQAKGLPTLRLPRRCVVAHQMIVTEQVKQQNQQADTRQISWGCRAQTEGRACQKTSGKTADAPECLERRHNRSSIRLLNDNSLGVDSNVDTAFGRAEQES